MSKLRIATLASALVAILVLAIGVGRIITHKGSPLVGALGVNSAHSTYTETERVPFYATPERLVEFPVGDGPMYQTQVSYEVPASRTDVTTFYTQIMAAQGWVEHTIPDSPSGAREFSWQDTSGEAPTNLYRTLQVGEVEPGFLGIGVKSGVDATTFRLPNLSMVPAFPDATNIIREQGKASDGSTRYILRYDTTATPQELARFYERVMPGTGWSAGQALGPGDIEKAIIEPVYGESFYAGTHTAFRILYGAGVYAQPSTDGKSTHVTSLSGDGAQRIVEVETPHAP